MTFTIHTYGDPVLREESIAVPAVTPDLRAFAAGMIETMRGEMGIGLAAQQVGRRDALCVVELPPEMDVDEEGERLHPDVTMPMVLINPVIHERSDRTHTREEGCLSFPDIHANIERAWTIRVTYMDIEGQSHDRSFHGMLARVIQHEVDHLNGVLFIDRMSHVKRLALKGRLRRLKEETEARLT